MSDGLPPLDRLARAIDRPALGAIGLADEILSIAADHDLRLGWHAGRCRAQTGDGGAIDLAIPRAAFRAVLARIAALCGEPRSGDHSPYEGGGIVDDGTSEPIRARFVNTPTEQSLELAAIRPAASVGSGSPRPATRRDERAG